MLKFILATLLGIALAGCSEKIKPPIAETSFIVSGKKITVRGNINAGATVTASQAEQAIKMSVNLLESGN